MRRIVVAVTTLLALSVLAAGCGGSTSSPSSTSTQPGTAHSTAGSATKPQARHGIPHDCAGNICTVPIDVVGSEEYEEREGGMPTAAQLASLCNKGGRINAITPVAEIEGSSVSGITSELIVVCEEHTN